MILRCVECPRKSVSGRRWRAYLADDPGFRLADVASTPSGVTMLTLELTGPPEYGEIEVE